MPRKETTVGLSPSPATAPRRAGASLPAGTRDFLELLTTPALQWPVERTPVDAQEHSRRRAAIAGLVDRRFDGGTPS